MLERDPKLGLCERLGDGDVVVYPLGALFRGVRLTEAESIKYGSRGRDVLWATALIVFWVSAVLLMTQMVSIYSGDAGRWFQHFANMQIYLIAPLQRFLRPFAMASHDAWTSDRPIDRERAGLEIVPRVSTAIILIGLFATGALVVLAYLFHAWPPARMDAIELSAKQTAALEFAVLVPALLAGMLWRNARTARLLAQVGRAEPAGDRP